MSTRITVNVNGSRLLQQARENQLANRQTLTQKESDDKFLADVRQIEASAAAQAATRQREGAVPEYGIQEQTSAQRGAAGIIGINGNAYFSLLTLEAVEPGGQSDSVEQEFPDIPPFPITIPEDVRVTESTGVTGGDLGFSTYYELNRRYKFWQSSGYTENLFILPINSKTAMFVYQVHKFKREAVSEETTERSQSNETYLFQISPGVQKFANRGTASLTSNFSIVQNYIEVTNQTACYVFNNKKIRQVNTPQELLDKLLRFYSIKLPGSVKQGTGVSETISGSYDDGPTPPIEFPSSQYVPGVVEFLVDESNLNEIASTNPGTFERVLARSFGIGNLTTQPHNKTLCFSPAVFKYINGDMDLTTNNANFYDYMRAEYFSNAPRKYVSLDAVEDIEEARLLAQDGLSVSEISEELNRSEQTITKWLSYQADEIPPVKFFQITSKAPVSIGQAMQENAFSDVKLGYRGLYNAWDWNNPNYCRSELSKLGFTAADLTP